MSASTGPAGPTVLRTLRITIRFSVSVPDLSLEIQEPSKTTVVSLKQLIRSKLPRASASKRLRLIYSGRLLIDTDLLDSALRLPPPPPKPPADPKGKGKAVDYGAGPALVFINCSIGDALGPEELSAEASAAKASTPLAVPGTANEE